MVHLFEILLVYRNCLMFIWKPEDFHVLTQQGERDGDVLWVSQAREGPRFPLGLWKTPGVRCEADALLTPERESCPALFPVSFRISPVTLGSVTEILHFGL